MHPKLFAATTCSNHMHVLLAMLHPNTLLNFSTFDSDPGAVPPQILEAAMAPMGAGEACFATCVGPQWPEWANTCLGLLLACVGTRPCTWLHRAMPF